MNTAGAQSPVPLEDVLYELALANPAPDAAVLDEFVRRYPEHAAALTEFAVELALDALIRRDDEPEAGLPPAANRGVSRAMSRFHNRRYALRQQAAGANEASRKTDNPFAALNRAGVQALAEHLHVNRVFVMKLRDRGVYAETIPEPFQRALAEGLRVPPQVLTAHFAGAPQVGLGAGYKADTKPEAGTRQTFEQAVRTSGLTPEQQDYLLSL